MDQSESAFPDFGLTPEQRRFAIRGNYYENPGMDGERGEIWCYTDRFSYAPGETVSLHVSSAAPDFGMEVTRDGGVEMLVLSRRNLPARWQDTPDQCSVEGCGWQASLEFRVEESWPSGAYRVTLTARTDAGVSSASPFPFTWSDTKLTFGSWSSSLASALMMPPPATISGRSASSSMAMAFSA
jgi:hypothetical protein